MYGGVWKKFQMTKFDMPNKVSSMKCALKTVPGLADVGVPHGDGDDPCSPSPRVRIKKVGIPRRSAGKTEGVWWVIVSLKAELALEYSTLALFY